MTNNEKLFRLLGWEPFTHPMLGISHWITPSGKRIEDTPDVSNFFELCRRWVIPEMRERGWDYSLSYIIRAADQTTAGNHYFCWGKIEKMINRKGEVVEYFLNIDCNFNSAEIIDDNIAAALVESAIEVLEGEK